MSLLIKTLATTKVESLRYVALHAPRRYDTTQILYHLLRNYKGRTTQATLSAINVIKINYKPMSIRQYEKKLSHSPVRSVRWQGTSSVC